MPPILQLLGLGLLGLFVIVSIAGRFSRQLGARVFSRPDRNSIDQVIEYTIVPILVFAGFVAAVVKGWDANRPWLGELVWWRSTVGTGISIVLGLLPAIGCFAALWPVSRGADRENPKAPLSTSAGKLYIALLIASILFLPAGVIGGIALRNWLFGKPL